MVPETSKPETYGKIPKESNVSPHANVIDAAASGASEGLTLALNVMAMLIAFIALIALLNAVLMSFGSLIGFENWGAPLVPEALRQPGAPPQLTLQALLGWFFAPLAWVIGISSEDQSHLFGRFFRGKNATNIQGTGLGLHIVARYVTLLNGKISVESELDKGTTFRVEIGN